MRQVQHGNAPGIMKRGRSTWKIEVLIWGHRLLYSCFLKRRGSDLTPFTAYLISSSMCVYGNNSSRRRCTTVSATSSCCIFCYFFPTLNIFPTNSSACSVHTFSHSHAQTSSRTSSSRVGGSSRPHGAEPVQELSIRWACLRLFFFRITHFTVLENVDQIHIIYVRTKQTEEHHGINGNRHKMVAMI